MGRHVSHKWSCLLWELRQSNLKSGPRRSFPFELVRRCGPGNTPEAGSRRWQNVCSGKSYNWVKCLHYFHAWGKLRGEQSWILIKTMNVKYFRLIIINLIHVTTLSTSSFHLLDDRCVLLMYWIIEISSSPETFLTSRAMFNDFNPGKQQRCNSGITFQICDNERPLENMKNNEHSSLYRNWVNVFEFHCVLDAPSASKPSLNVSTQET